MTKNTTPHDSIWTKNFIYAWIANFMMGFAFYLLIPTLPFYLIDQFKSDTSTIGIIIAAYVIAALLIRPFSGYIVDSFPRKFIYILSFSFFILFYAGYFIVSSIVFVLILRVLHGFTWGIITTSGNTLALDITPSHKRGQTVGFYGLAINISMALSPVVGIFIYEHYGCNALFSTAIIFSTIGLLFALLIQVPKKERKIHSKLSFDRFILLKAIPIGINLLIAAISYGMVLSFAAIYGKTMNATSGIFYLLLASGIACARIFSGKLIDSGKINQITIIGLITLTLSFTLFSLFKTPIVYYLMASTIGLGYGICYPAFQSIIISMAPHEMRGTANSTYYTAFDIGVGLGMYFAGKIAMISSLAVSFGSCAAIYLIALLFFMKISKNNYLFKTERFIAM